MSARVDVTGGVTIPPEVRQRIGLESGDEVDFVIDADGRVTLVKVKEDWAARQARLDPDRFRKMVGTLKSDMSVDEMMVEMRGERDDLPD